MQKNVLEYLEHTVKRFPDKIAYANGEEGITFREVYDRGRAIGTFLNEQGLYKQPVVVFMGRHPRAIVPFLALYMGVIFMCP